MTTATIPFTAGGPMIISGPTGSGKTYFVHKLMKYHMFTEKISTILYCYGVYQDYYDEMLLTIPNMIFNEGLPDTEK